MVDRLQMTSGTFAACAVVGAVLAALVLLLGFAEGGLDGPCDYDTNFVRSHPEAAEFRPQDSAWPPGQRCVAVAADGSQIAARTYPEAIDWVSAFVAFLIPFVGAVGFQRIRRARAPSGA